MGGPEDLPQAQLVRRFTAELEPASDLEIQTKQYQKDLDATKEARDMLRSENTYISNSSPAIPQSTFTGAEIARKRLKSKCDEFFTSLAQKEAVEKKKTSVLRFLHRESTGHKLAREIQAAGEFTVSQVSSITTQLETQWKGSHSKATTNFLNICRKLDDHKMIFQWFPDQTAYTSVLCGAVTMIIQVSVNYSSISEQLSGYIADLSDRISVCTRWLDLYDRPSMQARLSDIYAKFFDFFIAVASWYLKGKPSRLLDSFNSNFSESYRTAAEVIKNSIQLIHEEAQIETALEVKGIVPHVDQSLAAVEERITAQVLQARREGENEVGRRMYHVLMEMARQFELLKHEMKEGIDALKQGLPERVHALEIEDTGAAAATIGLPTGLSRVEAEQLCVQLQSTIDEVGGNDGIRLAVQAGRLVAEPRMVHMLGKWAQATSGNAQILWIISPWETGAQTSAQLAALGIIWTAIQAKAQFISYICQRPHYGKLPRFKGAEDKAGILAMVYSLIRQLLQFQMPEDKVEIPVEMVDKLTQTADNWDTAIELLKILLDNTPNLRYCIVSGLNLLEDGARDLAQEFVDVLLAHVQNVGWPVHLMFTTSGQSRVLSTKIARESKLMTNNTFRQMKGKILYPDLQLPE
ncbi:hypothetical protein BDV11DRAFT_10613 [Aspergillus similis]